MKLALSDFFSSPKFVISEPERGDRDPLWLGLRDVIGEDRVACSSLWTQEAREKVRLLKEKGGRNEYTERVYTAWQFLVPVPYWVWLHFWSWGLGDPLCPQSKFPSATCLFLLSVNLNGILCSTELQLIRYLEWFCRHTVICNCTTSERISKKTSNRGFLVLMKGQDAFQKNALHTTEKIEQLATPIISISRA